MSNWYQLNSPEVLQQLGSNMSEGLSQEQANHHLRLHGYNELAEQDIKKPWAILWEQLTETLVIILIFAAIVSGILGDYKDAIGIVAIVVLIALLGFTQEYRAQKAIATLKKLSVPTVKVRRSGCVAEISARQLVPGDIVELEAGDLVPADCRLLNSFHLRTQEAALTGESESVDKDPKALPRDDLPLRARQNMVYMGTDITYGQALAVVTETGMKTEFGRVAAMIQTVEPEPTPLQRRLDQLGKILAIASLVLVAVIFVLGLLRGEDIKLMFLTAITLVVAALPEGLPAVVTIALALGAQQLLKRRALIRKLPAVETLGSVTVICSGKTGTLTENRMTVTVLDVAGSRLDLTASLRSYTPSEERPSLLSQPPALSLLLAASTLCNDARLEADTNEPHSFHVVGDPTEGALVAAAARQGLWKTELEQTLPRVAEIPYDSERQRMTTVHQFSVELSQIPLALETVWHWNQGNGKSPDLAFTKGAVDRLLDISSHVWVNGRTEPLNKKWHKRISATYNQLINNGLRVLGVAFRFDASSGNSEQDLTFIGLVGMNDPARPQAREAVLTCKTAGIRPVMITGDHPLTSQHIARELGIAIDHQILTGEDLARLSPAELEQQLEKVSVYARVSPQQKFDIVQALQKQGQIVAMTGDGVNDAPALKAADIGIAMGIRGTDIAKEAADMVLLDDNFATIVAAVKEGRVIYDNIRKFIKYLLSSNSGELWVMLLAPFFGMPLPLLPLQILWINLTTDGLPALALSLEPAERGIMKRSPYNPNENIFGRGMGRDIIWVGLLMGFVSLGTGYCYWRIHHPGWQTMVFTVLTLSQMGNALAIRSERDSLFRIGLLSNKPLLAAVTLTLGLQLLVIYVPWLQRLFTTVTLSTRDLVLSLALSSVVFWAIELEKRLNRQNNS
ncbi:MULTISPECIES: cation-translocating P-type ATPase [Nostoc]|uniref:Cation-translocating P-type ATPase n=1 Tax=Nostoc paludosum FACHB-159 TaxID=2692908 RepID=A0ABR8KH45_9NOSO|nr:MULTISPECIES: cation-translocating P-type ATPase [Nostoc]MBD2681764.1 cation-translocating P-type ATPase [Nostoc sp. FACHB-857]MBD2738179.1 cation-translocating P-type ATPase [Nostoc paludosum FACHB-159]